MGLACMPFFPIGRVQLETLPVLDTGRNAAPRARRLRLRQAIAFHLWREAKMAGFCGLTGSDSGSV